MMKQNLILVIWPQYLASLLRTKHKNRGLDILFKIQITNEKASARPGQLMARLKEILQQISLYMCLVSRTPCSSSRGVCMPAQDHMMQVATESTAGHA